MTEGKLLKGLLYRKLNHKFSLQLNLLILAFTALLLAGCSGSILKSQAPTPDENNAQLAQQMESLRQELARVAPTLTALVKTPVISATPTLYSLPIATTMVLPSQTQPVNPTEPIEIPTNTKPVEALPTQTAVPSTPTTASVEATPTPKPVILASSLTPWVVQATPKRGAPVSATQPMVVLNGRLDLPTPTEFASESSILYQDDFSYNRGWFTTSNTRYILKIAQGKYNFVISTLDLPIWSVRTIPTTNVRIEVDAAQKAGPADGYYGLVCRQVDDRNYYILVASVNGAFGIGKVKDKELQYLASSKDYNNLIKPVGNRLRADCIGDTLTLYADGTKVLQAQDAEFKSGSTGLVAGNKDSPGIDVLFDNYLVVQQ